MNQPTKLINVKSQFRNLSSSRTLAAKVLLAGATLWCAVIFAAPLLPLPSAYGFFATICHQDLTRTWHLSGKPLAVCIRCTSIYVGFLCALILKVPPCLGFLRYAFLAALLEFLIARLFVDSVIARSLTGIAVGLASAGFIDRGFTEMFHREQQGESV